jgi:hypothetical protein
MSKYTKYQFPSDDEPVLDVHPVWRGIGCLLLVVLPILSYVLAMEAVRANMRYRWLPVPVEVSGFIDFSPVYYAIPAVRPFLLALGRIYYLDLIMAFVFSIIAFGLVTIAYSAVYRLSGQQRYGPTDAPQIKKSPKKGYGRSR